MGLFSRSCSLRPVPWIGWSFHRSICPRHHDTSPTAARYIRGFCLPIGAFALTRPVQCQTNTPGIKLLPYIRPRQNQLNHLLTRTRGFENPDPKSTLRCAMDGCSQCNQHPCQCLLEWCKANQIESVEPRLKEKAGIIDFADLKKSSVSEIDSMISDCQMNTGEKRRFKTAMEQLLQSKTTLQPLSISASGTCPYQFSIF